MKNSMINKNSRAIYKIALGGVLAALSAVLVWLIHFPIFPAVAFLEYDPADVPIIIATFALGRGYGLILTAVVSLLQGLTVSAKDGWYGIVMHIFATGTLVIAAGTVRSAVSRAKRYAESKIMTEGLPALAGTLAMTAGMAVWNLIITPLYMHCTVAQLMPLYPFIIMFNLVKAGLNSAVAVLIYRVLIRILPKTGRNMLDLS